MPGRDELPSTLWRSPQHAQDTWVEAHDSAVETYGEGERAHRVAFAAVKHSFEKVGAHWEPTEHGSKGLSDRRAARRHPEADRSESAEGVDAIARANRRETARARS